MNFFFFLFSIFSFCDIPNIKYSSIVQILNVYTDSHISMPTENSGNVFQLPDVFTSRPTFEDGWLWSVEPPHEDLNAAEKDVFCNSYISLSNHFTNNFISVKTNKDVVPTVGRMGNSSVWKVVCDNPETEKIWKQDLEFMLYNEVEKCYLSSSFQLKYQDDTSKYKINCTEINKFSVWNVKEGIFYN